MLQHQQVGVAGQGAVRHQLQPRRRVERDVAVHFAIDFQPGRLFVQHFQGLRIFSALGWLLLPKLEWLSRPPWA